MTAAEAGPPTRLCNMNMMLSSTTGNTASMPLPAGPSWKLNATTTPTRRATSPARSARSVHRGRNPLTRTWRNGRTSTRHTPNTVTFTTGTLAPGGSTSFQLTLATNPGLATPLVNTATVAPPTGVTDPVSGNNSSTDTDALTRQADLSIVKSNGKTTAVPGMNTIYTITVTNNGASSVTGAVVSDVLPSGTTFVSATGGAVYDSGANTVYSLDYDLNRLFWQRSLGAAAGAGADCAAGPVAVSR